MLKCLKFLYPIGANIYAHKSIFDRLRLKERSFLLNCDPIIDDMVKKGIKYNTLPDIIKLKVVGHSIGVSSKGLKSCEYICSCEYSEITTVIHANFVFDDKLREDVTDFINNFKLKLTDGHMQMSYTSFMRKTISNYLMRHDADIEYKLDLPSFAGIPIKLPECGLYDIEQAPDLSNEKLNTIVVDVYKDKVEAFTSVRFAIGITNYSAKVKIIPTTLEDTITLKDLSKAKIVEIRQARSRQKEVFN